MSSSSSTPRTSGSHPIGPEKRKRPWWLLLLAAVVAILLLLLLLSRCGGDDATPSRAVSTASATATTEPSDPAASSSTAAGTASSEAAVSSTPATTAPVSPSVPANAGGTLTADVTPLLPLAAAAPDGSLRSYTGQQVSATAVQVLSVPANEGFWVGSSDTDRIWVQIVGSGESPYQVKTGDIVDFTGSMVKHARGFAGRVGVDDGEGAQLLTQQRAHVAAQQSTLTKSAG